MRLKGSKRFVFSLTNSFELNYESIRNGKKISQRSESGSPMSVMN